jgi:hypothetical protein
VIDLQEIGIDPDRIAGAWTEEIDQLVRLEVNEAIMGASAGTAHQAAQTLSSLRDRWLYASVRSARREARGSEPSPRPAAAAAQTEDEERRVRAEARKLAGEAVAESVAPPAREAWTGGGRALPWRLVAPAAAGLALCLTLGLHALGVIDLLGRDLDRWNEAELVAVSEYLASGHRSGGGQGDAFVGTVDEAWLALPLSARQSIGREIVHELRERGIQQVMIYDESHELRIQGLGRTVHAL